MTGFPSRRIFRRAVLDEGIAVIRLVQVFELQIEIRTRDLERRDLAVAKHREIIRIRRRRIKLQFVLASAVGEIVVLCICARKLDAVVDDVVLLRLFRPRRGRRIVFARISCGNAEHIQMVSFILLSVFTIVEIAKTVIRRGRRGADLDDIRIVKLLRDCIGLEPQCAAVDRVRMRRQRRVAILILQFIVIEER